MSDQTPLLSDEQIEWDMTIVEGDAMFQTMSPWKVRELYEADRQALLSVVQEAVDVIAIVAKRRGPFHADIEAHRILSKIKSIYNISPKP